MKTVIKQNIKLPKVTYNPSLDKLEDKILFPKKLEAAIEHLKKSGFPGIIPKQK